jgi:hypothetical protein
MCPEDTSWSIEFIAPDGSTGAGPPSGMSLDNIDVNHQSLERAFAYRNRSSVCVQRSNCSFEPPAAERSCTALCSLEVRDRVGGADFGCHLRYPFAG